MSASASDPIMDWDGRPIEVGTRVRYFDFLPGHPDWGIHCLAPMYCGTVTDADPTDWDGDVDDEGRSYGIPPHVYVLFDDGTTQGFVTGEWEHYPRPQPGVYDYEMVNGKVEELCVIGAPDVGRVQLRTQEETNGVA